MTKEELQQELKALIVSALGLEDIKPEDIETGTETATEASAVNPICQSEAISSKNDDPARTWAKEFEYSNAKNKIKIHFFIIKIYKKETSD